MTDLARYRQRALFCVTHSDRPHEPAKCHLNYLEARYSQPDRLPATQPFETLTPSQSHSPYGGKVTLYDIAGRVEQPRLVLEFRPADFKPQHAVWHDSRLWILGVECLDVYDVDLRRLTRVVDPWLAGGHTIAPDGTGRMLVSCSASDAVLVIDAHSYDVVDALRMPEHRYGTNYPLQRSHSVVDHYITNDLQLTHVNCAWPFRQGILTSALIPGAVGWFSPQREFTELITGYVGCHGARVRPDTETLYFSDSCTGILMLLDRQLKIRQRLDTNSTWLHDALHIEGDVFAAAAYDRNVVEFWDAGRRQVISQIDCTGYGAPQFLAYAK